MEKLLKELKSLTEKVQSAFESLDAAQLNWKAGTKDWSIAQCLDHLMLMNEKYVKQLTDVIDNYEPSFWEKYSPLTGFTGRQLIESLGPNVRKKYVAPKAFTPTKSFIDINVIQRFLEHQETLLKLFTRISESDGKRVITSPVAPLITIYSSDAMQIITEHEKRHINQAMRVKEMSGFPQ